MRFAACLGALLLPGAIGLTGCGGDDPDCVIDTDCPLFQRCQAGACVDLGALDGGGDAAVDAARPEGGMDSGPDDDGGVDAGPPVERTGTVVASQTPMTTPETSPFSFSASFEETTDGGDADCTSSEADPCRITECTVEVPMAMDGGVPMDAGMDAGPMDAGPTADAGAMEAPNAGIISLSGGAMDLVLSPMADGTYDSRTGTGLLWNEGDALVFNGAGDAVPAFTETLTGPGLVTVSAPSFMSPPLSVDRTTTLSLTWSGGSMPGEVHVLLTGSEMTDGTMRSVTVDCAYDGASGAGDVPAEALGALPSGAGGSLAVGTAAQTTVDAGDWNVTVRAQSVARADTGSPATISVTYTP